jgi:2,3-diketo-5-methylthio-1-phosphopentane phosphatase
VIDQKAILLDIEGTTVPITFVYNILFPYSRERMFAYLSEHGDDPEIQNALLNLKVGNQADVKHGAPASNGKTGSEYLNWAATYCLWLMDRDRKTTSLKMIQGLIWEEGFNRGELQSELFSDVPGCLSSWHANRHRIAIYSSGSVSAQKLVFGYTPFGNLLPFIEAFFDTRTGPKQDAKSYERIASELSLEARDVLFVSDVLAELDAASTAGMSVALSIRPGNAPVSNNHFYRTVTSLKEL